MYITVYIDNGFIKMQGVGKTEAGWKDICLIRNLKITYFQIRHGQNCFTQLFQKTV